MPWGALLTRGRTAGARPAWGEVTSHSSGLIDLLGHIERVDEAVVRLGRAVDAAIPERRPHGPADPAEVARAYAAAADGLVELSRESLGRDPSAVVARFVDLSRDVVDHLDDRGDDLLGWLDAVGAALRSDRVLLPATPPPGVQDLGGVLHELRRAVNAQLNALARPTFGRRDSDALERRTAEALRQVRTADALAAGGEMTAAVATLAVIALPCLPDGPSTAFTMASRAATVRLRRVAAGYDAAVARLVEHASGLVDHHVGTLVEVMTASRRQAEPAR